MKKKMGFVVLGAMLLTLFFVAVNLGSIHVTPQQLFSGLFLRYDENVAIIFDLRFPRIFLALLAGGALAVSGVLFQAVLRNPLADPGIIGISGGASLTAAIVALFFPQLFFLTPVLAFLGAMGAFVLIYVLAWDNALRPVRVLLVGIAIGAVFSGLTQALSSFSQGVSPAAAGNISMRTWAEVQTMAWFAVMIQTYCKGHRHSAPPKGLCETCLALKEYAYLRVERCPFQETKTFCAHCSVHCYQKEMREKIRRVMRYSGPRILFYHPIMVLSHLLQTIQAKISK